MKSKTLTTAVMKGKVLITGATSGLGLAYAKEYAGKGYDLILTGRRKEKLEKNANDIRHASGVNVRYIIVELSAQEGLDYLIDEIRCESIEVLINNAGYGLRPAFAELAEEDIAQLLFLQTETVVMLTRFVLTGMLQRNSGTIINVSSDSAFAVMPSNVLYASTKTFLLTFTEGLYMEFLDTDLHVQVICPGFMDSDFHESAGMKVDKHRKGFMKFTQPEEIVGASMKDLARGKVVSEPTFDVKLIHILSRILPRKIFYRMVISFTKKLRKSRNGR